MMQREPVDRHSDVPLQWVLPPVLALILSCCELKNLEWMERESCDPNRGLDEERKKDGEGR